MRWKDLDVSFPTHFELSKTDTTARSYGGFEIFQSDIFPRYVDKNKKFRKIKFFIYFFFEIGSMVFLSRLESAESWYIAV